MKVTFLVGMCVLAGCSFKVGGATIPGDQDLAIPHPDPAADLATGADSDMPTRMSTDMATPPGADLMKPADLGPVCVAAAKRCSTDGKSLETCRADRSGFDATACPFDCSAVGGAVPHCRVLVPTAPVMTSDFNYGNFTATTLANGNYVFDTNDGTITGPGGIVRHGTTAGTATVSDGIGFHRSGNVAIWSFASLSVGADATVGFTETLSGANTVVNQFGIAFVSQGDVSINATATIDVRGYLNGFSTRTDGTNAADICNGNVPGPGGGAGGEPGVSATGTGGGSGATATSMGGGGASFGGTGALGGNATNGATPPATYGTTSLSPLVGGSGGGAGGGTSGSTAAGGGGGGILYIVSGGAISVGGAINAGGCSGGGSTRAGGGGGGSGGAILLEAGTITLSGTVSANGGGAGGGGQSGPGGGGGGDGTPGQAGAVVAPGGSQGGIAGGAGGNGGFAGTASTPGGASVTDGAGGGGGGVGRIRLNTKSGTATGQSTQLSPSVVDGAASVGTLNLQ